MAESSRGGKNLKCVVKSPRKGYPRLDGFIFNSCMVQGLPGGFRDRAQGTDGSG